MRNQGTILGVAISLLVISAVFIYVVYAYIPNKEKQMRNAYEQMYQLKGVFVVGSTSGIDAGTLVTKELFEDGTINMISIPDIYIPHSLKDPERPDELSNRNYLVIYTNNAPNEGNKEEYRNQLIGKVIATRLEQGTMISNKSFGEEAKVDVDHTKRNIQIEVHNEAGDLLKAGKYVDLILQYKNGEYDIVIPKKYVDKIVADPETGATTSAEGNSKIQFSVDEREYRDYELARRLGDMAVRVYTDANQYAALKTFDYERYMNIVNNAISKDDLTGEHKEYYSEISFLIQEGKKDITLSTEYNIKIQEYADVYYNNVEKYILKKTVVSERLLEEELLYNAIKKYLESANVDVSGLSRDEILEYDFKSEQKRKDVVELISGFTAEEKIKMLASSAKDKLKEMSLAKLLEIATAKNNAKMKAALEAKTGETSEKISKAISALSEDDMINIAYVTGTGTVQNVKDRLTNAYKKDQITVGQLAYISGLGKVDIVIALVEGNKSIASEGYLNRAQIYESFSSKYDSKLDTRRLVADKIVEKALLFYQTYGTKIDSIAYLIKNNLYNQYVK